MKTTDEIRAVLRDLLADLTSYYAAQYTDLGEQAENTWSDQIHARLQQLSPDEAREAVVLLLAPDARGHALDMIRRANRPTDHDIQEATR